MSVGARRSLEGTRTTNDISRNIKSYVTLLDMVHVM